MSTQTPTRPSVTEERVVVRETPRRRPRMSVSSAAAGIVGIGLLVIGIVVLARTGIPTEDLTTPVVAVGPFMRTALMGIIEIVAGLLALAAAADRDLRGASSLGVVAGVFGIVWLIEPRAFAGALGVTVATGWLYAAVAAVLLGAVALDRYRR